LVIGLDMRLGIDVGGTNTDAVVLDRGDRLLAKVKVASTADVTSGISAAIDAILDAPGVDKRRITHVMLGTTHATNAVLQRRDLRRVAVLRIGGPATRAVRPLYSWPDELRSAISVGETIVDGGIEFDGRELVPFDRDAAAAFLASVAEQVDAVAITSVFAPISASQELQAEELVRREVGNVHVSLSHEIGTLGLLERENATVLNAALVGVARDVAFGLQAALAGHALRPVMFFAQNDGTLMGADYALRYPVLTIGSGPANFPHAGPGDHRPRRRDSGRQRRRRRGRRPHQRRLPPLGGGAGPRHPRRGGPRQDRDRGVGGNPPRLSDHPGGAHPHEGGGLAGFSVIAWSL